MTNFMQTKMGRKLIEGDIPQISKSLSDIATELKKIREIEEDKWKKEKERNGW